jgi:glycosyltransferase involved in cell wall biosynthesis
MRIAIDALGIQNFGGGRTATLTLLEALFALDNHNQYYVFLSQVEKSFSAYQDNVHQIISPFKNRFLLRCYAQTVLPILTRNFNLVHFTKNLGVFGLKSPFIVTVYDMTTLIHPELFPKLDVLYWKSIEKLTLHKASRVIAISETTANDLKQFYALQAEQIKVIYPSINARFKPATNAEINQVSEKYHLPKKYIIHVGRIDRKKKLTLLVEAYAQAKNNCKSCSMDSLLLVGEVYPKSKDDALMPTIQRLGLTEDVIFLHRVSDADLPAIISGAKAAVSASVHEGFGLAAIEALACGTPLIAYRAGALQEVVGDAAVLIDNLDQNSLANALIQISDEPELRSDLCQRGLFMAQKYKPERNARQTLQLYEEIGYEN